MARTGQGQAVSLVHSFCSATPGPLSTSEVSGPLFHTYAHMGGGVLVRGHSVTGAGECGDEGVISESNRSSL